MPDQKDISSTSQNFLDIHDITNDIVILKNGSASVVLTVNAMNFGLLAEQEQDSIIYAYAGLLNSINYPIQILIQSQTKDASSYLKLLDEREKKTKDKLKQAWIRRYSKFVSDLIRERNVLDKKFFVVIPASSLEMGLTPAQDLISGFKEQSIEGVEKSVILEKAKNLLDPKRDHLIAQFNRIGLYARQLSTEEIIRLFYTNYNPEASEGQQITNSENYTTALVQAQIRGNYMNDQAQNTPQPTPTAPLNQAPVTQPEPEVVNKNTTATEVNISESPVLQKPAAVPTVSAATSIPTPMTTPNQPTTSAPTIPTVEPVSSSLTPPTPPTIPSVEPSMTQTVEITQPEPDQAPVVAAPSTPTPSTNIPAPTPTPLNPVETPTATQAPLSTDNTQKNINETINQMTEKPTQ